MDDEKRDFFSGLTLSERVNRIEEICGLRNEAKTDHPKFNLTEGQGHRTYTVNSKGLQQAGLSTEAPSSLEDLYNLIQNATDRVYRQAGKLENVGDRILGPLPEAASGKNTGDEQPPLGTLEQVYVGLKWLGNALSRLEAATDRLEQI